MQRTYELFTARPAEMLTLCLWRNCLNSNYYLICAEISLWNFRLSQTLAMPIYFTRFKGLSYQEFTAV